MEEARLQKQEGSAETIFIQQQPSGRPALISYKSAFRPFASLSYGWGHGQASKGRESGYSGDSGDFSESAEYGKSGESGDSGD